MSNITATNEPAMLTLSIEMPEDQLEALAIFLKRLGYMDCRENAVNEKQAYEFIYSAERLALELAKHGFAPR